jgi:hypothetical protein
MGKRGPSAPPAPDPVATANAQASANKEAVRESAKVNAVDIYNPYGSTVYERNADGTPKAQRTTLSPGSQYIYDRQQEIGAKLADTANNRVNGIVQSPYTNAGLPYDPRSYDTSTLPTYQGQQTRGPQLPQQKQASRGFFGFGVSAPPNPTAPDRNFATSIPAVPQGDYAFGVRPPRTESPRTVGNSIYEQAVTRLNPRFEQEERRFEQTMANRGLPITGEAYRTARADFDRNRNDAYNDAVYRAIQGEDAIANSRFGRDVTAATTNDQLAGNQFTRGLQAATTADALTSNALGRDVTRNQTDRANFQADRANTLQDFQQQQSDWLRRLQVEQNLRGQINNDLLTERNQGINEVSAILQGSPALGMPNAPAVPTYQIAAPDIIGATNAAYNAQVQNYQAQQASRNSLWQGALGIASSALPFLISHPNLKVVLGDA